MKLYLTFSLLLFVSLLYAQDTPIPVLERNITITAVNQPLGDVLKDMSRRGNFTFSYSPQVINSSRPVSLKVQDRSVRFILNLLFKDEKVEYKEKGKYIILKRTPAVRPADQSRILEGYVYDSHTGKKVTEASIYDKDLMASAVTDQYGYFSLEFPAGTPLKSLQISKVGYHDTLLLALDSAMRIRNLEIRLKQDSVPEKRLIDFEQFRPEWFLTEKQQINSRNITVPLFRSVQFSLLPSLSTNKFLGGATVNYVSLNATMGYVQGIRLFEAAGLINYDRTDVSYLQIAGAGNLVRGKVKGFQGAFLFNQSRLIWGLQLAGGWNLVKDTATAQFAGISNKAGMNVMQVSGIYNLADQTNFQAGGLLNRSRSAAFQLAGVINQADTVPGAQTSVLMNVCKTGSIVQLAGIANYTGNEVSVQIAGLVNKAESIKDFQLALFNIADTSSAVSLGLFSFIRKGYHRLEFSADETFPVNIAFRTGTLAFHTFLNAGTAAFRKQNLLWNMGYGLGTSFGNPEKYLFDLDLTISEVTWQNHLKGTYHWYKFYFGTDRKITGKLSFVAGISFNALLSDSLEPDFNEISSRMPFYTLSSTNYSNGHNLKTWIGGKAGIRFD